MGSSANEGLTKRLMEHLKSLHFITQIAVVGSRAKQVPDAYSDVDLLLIINDIAPDQALYELTESVKTKFQPAWYDFANSLMPDKFLVSTFIGGDNPFAFYDIAILNTNKNLVYDQARFENDPGIHLMKLWVMNFKYMMRGAPQFEQRYATMMDKAGLSPNSDYRVGFYQLLLQLKGQKNINNGYLAMLEKVFRDGG